MSITMHTDENMLAQLRLLQLLSTAAPVGSFSYSQGLEWAVNAEWVKDEDSFRTWIEEQINSCLGEQELPLLIRLHGAWKDYDQTSVKHWSQFAVAVRDTAELRQEERDRAASYYRIVRTLETMNESIPGSLFLHTPLTSIAWFCVQHKISVQSMLIAFAHNWLESSLVTGVKTIPLGQSAGQRLLFELAPHLVTVVKRSFQVNDENVGMSLPALSMASCAHETQYSRIYRS